jgi:triacylglycerol lipase
MKDNLPLIFVPGIARFDAPWNFLARFINRHVARLDRFTDRFHYFRNVRSTLRAHGFDVYHAQLPFAASSEMRARELKRETLHILQKTGAKKACLIAHSMGGLDARRMIVNEGMAPYVDTLVTIGTPHLGSSFANWGEIYQGAILIKALHQFFDLTGFLDLTTGACAKFNAEAYMSELANDVRYITYAASQDRSGVFKHLQGSWDIISAAESAGADGGANDGLVSVASQRWVEYLQSNLTTVPRVKQIIQRTFPFPADHFNQCGHYDRHEKQQRAEFEEQVLAVYLEIAQLCTAGTAPHWEAVPDDPHPDDEEGGRFWRVRWSEPNGKGEWLYVRHYGGNGSSWNQSAAKREAEMMNKQKRRPSEWR